MPDDSTKTQFRIEEFKALRSEIDGHLASIAAVEREVVLGCAALWAWGYTRLRHRGEFLVAFAVPVVLALLGWFRREAHINSLRLIGNYIREEIEESFALSGWETYNRSETHRKAFHALGISQHIVWAALGVIAVVILVVAAVTHPAVGVGAWSD